MFNFLLYYKKLSEKISKHLRIYNINCSFRSQLSLKNLLCKEKSRLSPFDALGIVYKIPCKNCDSDYVAQTGRTSNIRLNEHRKSYKKGDFSSKLVIHSL